MLWELPQIVVGRLVSKRVGKYVHSVDGVRIFVTDKFDGMSLGDTVFINPNAVEGTWLVRHEFGHVKQSRYLGWMYLLLIFLPSYIWNRTITAIDKLRIIEDWRLTYIYYQFYTEWWANWVVA